MEEEKKEEIESLENTAPIKPVTEEVATVEPVTEEEASVEVAPEVSPTQEIPIINSSTEQPVEQPVETAPAPEQPAPVESAPVVEAAPVEPVTPAEPTEPAPEVITLPKPEEPKKKGKGGLIIVILLILALAGAGVWYFVLGGNGSKKEEPKKDEEQKEDKKDDKKEEDKIIELKEEDIEDYDNLISYFIRIMDTKKKVEAKELNNQDILFSAYALELDQNEGYFKTEDMKKAVQKVFGDIKYTDEPIKCRICGNALYKYDSEGQTYEQAPSEDHGHGGEGGLRFKYYFENGTRNETKGIQEINLKIVYGDVYGDVYGPNQNLYLTADDAKNSKNGVNTQIVDDEKGYDSDSDYKDAYDKHKDEIAITTFTFEKDSTGNYAFVKVETK